MKRFLAICIAATVGFIACTPKETTTIDTVNDADRTFAKTASPLYLSGSEIGTLAYSNCTDSNLIRLSEKIVMTSNHAYNELIQLGVQKGFYVPGSMDEEHEAAEASLATLAGWQFDSAYVHMLVADQHHILAAFDIVAQTGNNVTLKKHAAAFADTMLMYHEIADSLADLY